MTMKQIIVIIVIGTALALAAAQNWLVAPLFTEF
jgi:hypothetical protein